jgi:long-chain fatty acid transport protein
MHRAHHTIRLTGFLILPVFIGVPSDLSAAGFLIFEQGVKGLGTAFAGAAATAEDASTVFYNPAGMTYLRGTQLQGAGYGIFLQAEFTDQASTTASGAPLTGQNDDAGTKLAVANFYGTHALTDRVAVGLGVNTPFGLKTEYSSDWIGRYHAIKSELRTINFNPSVGFKVNELVSIGAGLDVQYADAELSNAIDFGTLLSGTGLTRPQENDGFARLEAEDWGVGYNVGIVLSPLANTRIGLAYRSKIEYDLRGDIDFDKSPTVDAILANLGDDLFVDTSAHAELTLPQILSAGLYHRLNPQWALMVGLTWTQWDTLQDVVVIRSDNPSQPPTSIVLNYDDAFRYSIGAHYFPNETYTFRFGLAYDETPIPNAESRSARLPDEDRLWLGLGASYEITQRFSLDFAYAHLFIKDAQIRSTLPASNPQLRSTLVGESENSVDIIGAQLNWVF